MLARKWRPRRFSELVGQDHVVRALVSALDQGRLHHAFLFTGTRGVGKTTIARILAKSLNCETGVSAQPCGECKTCREVDGGRFVDLIEVDAASRTKVDDTRELLDNVQYAPTCGRYKVYLIDEVHMLSGHSFNALLKTLEEPPSHVKFLFATTDPQKLPVTVLSRCLQFNLKALTPELIGMQLEKILQVEQIPFDMASLRLLAQSADGSMRDALSLLDQAIAFGGGNIKQEEVREMLGAIDQDEVDHLLRALALGDPQQALAVVAEMAQYNRDYDALLKELLLSLHRIALAQIAPNLVTEALGSEIEPERLLKYAQMLSAEDVQLFYQIGLIGRRDLPLAPTPRTGLEMILMRMLAFRPGKVESQPGVSKPNVPPITQKISKDETRADPKVDAAIVNTLSQDAPAIRIQNDALDSTSWREMVEQLKLTGLARELANNAALDSMREREVILTIDEAFAHLNNKERLAVLKKALEEYYGHEIKLQILSGKITNSPAKTRQREQEQRQEAAVAAIKNDPTVRALQENFNARVNPATIRPKVD